MKIRLIKDWRSFKAGEVVNLPDSLARRLITWGVAEEDKAIPKLEHKA